MDSRTIRKLTYESDTAKHVKKHKMISKHGTGKHQRLNSRRTDQSLTCERRNLKKECEE